MVEEEINKNNTSERDGVLEQASSQVAELFIAHIEEQQSKRIRKSAIKRIK